jgi:DNA-binding winged helix-turn-helix (wHTH) protein
MAHGDRSVDVFVRKLRQKLRTASPTWSYIHTHFGVGYRFAPAPDDPEHGDLHAVPDKDTGTVPPAPEQAADHHTADLVA